jgi:hypothetical protein
MAPSAPCWPVIDSGAWAGGGWVHRCDGRTDMIAGSCAVVGRTMLLRRRLHRLNVIPRDVAAAGVQNVHVMHLTSKKGDIPWS